MTLVLVRGYPVIAFVDEPWLARARGDVFGPNDSFPCLLLLLGNIDMEERTPNLAGNSGLAEN